MNIKNALAGISVREIEAAAAWYRAVIGRPPDIRPMDGVAGWQFPGGGWVEIFEDSERAGFSTVILAVESLEQQLELTAKLGIEVENKEIPSIGTVALIRDPDGNMIVFAGPTTGVLDD
ncbi:MAG: VOC family protein [Verrucomicrobiota bacterium]